MPDLQFAIQISSQHLVDLPQVKPITCTPEATNLASTGAEIAPQMRVPAPKLKNSATRASESVPKQPPLLAPDLVAAFNVNQQEIDRDIEHGRNATLPLWNRDPHH